MDYAELINYHRAKGADVTVATTPADEDHALHLGVLQVIGEDEDEDGDGDERVGGGGGGGG